MDLVLGGVAASTAGVITNPLEVVKTRMQLQGELLAKGNYPVYYRNVFHAAYIIARTEGLLALQKGVTSFASFHFVINGIRLGTYQSASNLGLNKSADGSISSIGTFLCGAVCGGVGAFASSPLYLVKTQLQSFAHKSIAVGHQHDHQGMIDALILIQRKYGIHGLWRGATSSILRIMVASSVQLLFFEKSREFAKVQLHMEGVWTPLVSACIIAGFFASTAMAPFDLITTRFYNQPINEAGKGLLYRNVKDCMVKVFQKEGFSAFFKGWTACYFRLGPFTFCNLIIWDRLKEVYANYRRVQYL